MKLPVRILLTFYLLNCTGSDQREDKPITQTGGSAAAAPAQTDPAALRLPPAVATCVRMKDEFKKVAGRCAFELRQCAAVGPKGVSREPGVCPACDEMDTLTEALKSAGCM